MFTKIKKINLPTGVWKGCFLLRDGREKKDSRHLYLWQRGGGFREGDGGKGREGEGGKEEEGEKRRERESGREGEGGGNAPADE